MFRDVEEIVKVWLNRGFQIVFFELKKARFQTFSVNHGLTVRRLEQRLWYSHLLLTNGQGLHLLFCWGTPSRFLLAHRHIFYGTVDKKHRILQWFASRCEFRLWKCWKARVLIQMKVETRGILALGVKTLIFVRGAGH